MQQLLAVASRQDWPSVWDLRPYQVERVEELSPTCLPPSVAAMVLVPGPTQAVAPAATALRQARRAGDVALLLAGRPRAQPLEAILREYPFDGVIDLDWPQELVVACIDSALRSVELGRNVVEIQRAVLEQTRKDAASWYDLAVHDDLTHLFNHRHFSRLMAREHDRSRRRGRPYSLVFVDLDNLKALNTRYGHAGGSRALRELAQVLTESVRSSDTALRIGGDEFVLFLKDCDKAAAWSLANRICERLRVRRFGLGGTSLSITVSAGVASYPEDGTQYPVLLERADHALLWAKARGKNRAVVWTPEIDAVARSGEARWNAQ